MKKKRKQRNRHLKITAIKPAIFFKMKSRVANISLEDRILALETNPKGKIILALMSNFLCGIAILIYTDTVSVFFIHLICLTLNMVITLSIGREYARTINFLNQEISKNKCKPEYIELKGVYKKFRKHAFHILNLIPCIVVLGTFFWGIFSQQYIELDIVGFYAVFIVSVAVSISVIGYVQYLWILWFLYRIGKCDSVPYNKVIPAHTPFLIKIATLTKHGKWCFFLEGFLYVFQYFILIPNDKVTSTSINMPDNFSFIITWVFIFVVIILAFPIIIFTQEMFLSKIISNFKSQRIEVLLTPLHELQNRSDNSIAEIYACNYLINSLINSPDYPVKIQRLGPATVSIMTLLLHIANLVNQYPGLKKFLVNRLFGNGI